MSHVLYMCAEYKYICTENKKQYNYTTFYNNIMGNRCRTKTNNRYLPFPTVLRVFDNSIIPHNECVPT